ncbi:MAG: AraC family transcriptional regulator [Candidatus Cloacimonetes bacterium]|nr:AraC family transcriptional regulator [Candidatus Cloacimonadota bacterium]MDD3869920.1 AraC family transcriptional regulator [Candidatus Cloacimonadota bacterium]
MKSIMHEMLNLSTGSPVIIKWCDYDNFKYPFHFHGEYEIIYIVKSSGKRFIGKNIENYTDGDLVLIGSFVPHMYRSDDVYHQNNKKLRVHAIIIQFAKDFFNHAIRYYPEFQKINHLLEESQYGICFNDKSNDNIRTKMWHALNLKGLNLLIECINILSLMSDSTKRLLNDESADNSFDKQYDDPRLIRILSFLHLKYTQPLSLSEIASVAGMNNTAFCRFFRSKTSKSCLQYINELRVNYACGLLLEGKLTMAQICFETGFNNISNFNRQFKKITKYTPSKYLEEFKRR